MKTLVCPECNGPMEYDGTLEPGEGERDDIHVYRCTMCNIAITSVDHLPLPSTPLH